MKVAVAAPPTTPNISFKDLAWSSPVDGILEGFFGLAKCYHDTTTKVVKTAGLEKLYANLEAKFDEILDVKYKECIELKDLFDKES